jgi:hypothetical protein
VADLQWSPRDPTAPLATATHVWTAGDAVFVAADLGYIVVLSKVDGHWTPDEVRIPVAAPLIGKGWARRADAELEPDMLPALDAAAEALHIFCNKVDSGGDSGRDETE